MHLKVHCNALAIKPKLFRVTLVVVPQIEGILTIVAVNSPELEHCFDAEEERLEQVHKGAFSGRLV